MELGNDLIYIPNKEWDCVDHQRCKLITARLDQIWNQFDNFIKQDKYLNAHRGEYVQKNGAIYHLGWTVWICLSSPGFYFDTVAGAQRFNYRPTLTMCLICSTQSGVCSAMLPGHSCLFCWLWISTHIGTTASSCFQAWTFHSACWQALGCHYNSWFMFDLNGNVPQTILPLTKLL